MQNGTIGWIDLTVDDAAQIREFYQAVVGWVSSPVAMDGYDDYVMLAPSNKDAVAGVCHRRGSNSSMPPQWMIYVGVADLDASMAACEQHGGEVLVRDREMGAYGRMSVIRDPAGAVMALLQPPAKPE